MLDLLKWWMNNGKTYLAAIGLFGLAVYQFSTGDYHTAIETAIAAAGLAGLRQAVAKAQAESVKATAALSAPMAYLPHDDLPKGLLGPAEYLPDGEAPPPPGFTGSVATRSYTLVFKDGVLIEARDIPF
jgi:hypothetical protein